MEAFQICRNRDQEHTFIHVPPISAVSNNDLLNVVALNILAGIFDVIFSPFKLSIYKSTDRCWRSWSVAIAIAIENLNLCDDINLKFCLSGTQPIPTTPGHNRLTFKPYTETAWKRCGHHHSCLRADCRIQSPWFLSFCLFFVSVASEIICVDVLPSGFTLDTRYSLRDLLINSIRNNFKRKS